MGIRGRERRSSGAPVPADTLQTERDGRRAAEQLAASFERMLAVVGHELRNPLGAMLLGITSLQRQSLTPAQAQTVDHILAGAERMRRMVGVLQEVAAIRREGLRLNRRPCDLRDLAARAIVELKAAFPGCEVELTVAGSTRGQWDPDRVTDMVANLVRNALQHATDASARVHLAPTADGVSASVTNFGTPIPPATRATLFDPFSRPADASPGKRRLGLGLYIVKSIVDAHKGSIEVRSARATGTTFTVTLPHGEPS